MRLLILDHCCPKFYMDHPSSEKGTSFRTSPERGSGERWLCRAPWGKKGLALDSSGGSREQRGTHSQGEEPESWTWVGKTGTVHLPTSPRAAPMRPPSWKRQHGRAQPFRSQEKIILYYLKNCDYRAFKTVSESKNHLIRYPVNSIWLTVEA